MPGEKREAGETARQAAPRRGKTGKAGPAAETRSRWSAPQRQRPGPARPGPPPARGAPVPALTWDGAAPRREEVPRPAQGAAAPGSAAAPPPALRRARTAAAAAAAMFPLPPATSDPRQSLPVTAVKPLPWQRSWPLPPLKGQQPPRPLHSPTHPRTHSLHPHPRSLHPHPLLTSTPTLLTPSPTPYTLTRLRLAGPCYGAAGGRGWPPALGRKKHSP